MKKYLFLIMLVFSISLISAVTTITDNSFVSTGNVSANYFLGNGSFLTGLLNPLGYWLSDGSSTATGDWYLGNYNLVGYQRDIGKNMVNTTNPLDILGMQNIFSINERYAMGLQYPHGNLVLNGKVYFSSNNIGGTAYIKVFNSPTTNLSNISTITIPSSYGIPAMCYDAGTDRIYAVSGSEGFTTPKILSINPHTNNYTIIANPAGTNRNSAIGTNGQFIYVGIQDAIKVYDMNGSYITIIGITDGGVVHAMKTTEDGTVIGTTYNWGGFFKINSTTNTITTVAIPPENTPTDDFVIIGDYAYLGDETGGHTEGMKVNWRAMTYENITGLSEAWIVSRNGDNVYFGGETKELTVYNIITGAKSKIQLGSAFNELEFVGGYGFLTTYTSSSAIYKAVLEPEIVNIPIISNINDGTYGLNSVRSVSSPSSLLLSGATDVSLSESSAGAGFYIDSSRAFGGAQDLIFYQGFGIGNKIRFQTPDAGFSNTLDILALDDKLANFSNLNITTIGNVTANTFISNSKIGLTKNYTNGNCWMAYSGGIMYATNCSSA